MSPPEFRAPHCTRYRYRYSECRRCADACPHGAIGLTDEGVTVGTAPAGTARFVLLLAQRKRLRPQNAAPDRAVAASESSVAR